MKLITKDIASLREGLKRYQVTGIMPECTDGAREIMARLTFIFEQLQVLKVVKRDIQIQLPEKKNKHLKNPKKSELSQDISIKRQVVDLLQEKFAPITYQQAVIDYQRASEIFNFNIYDDALLKLNVAEEEAYDSYIRAKEADDNKTAERFLSLYVKIQQSKPTIPREQVKRPTKITVEFNPYLLKACNVVETQEELDELEQRLRDRFSGNQNKKTFSNILNKHAQEVEIVSESDN